MIVLPNQKGMTPVKLQEEDVAVGALVPSSFYPPFPRLLPTSRTLTDCLVICRVAAYDFAKVRLRSRHDTSAQRNLLHFHGLTAPVRSHRSATQAT